MNETRKPPPHKTEEEKLDDELDATFPASDPPSYTTPIFAGGPKRARAFEDRPGAGKRQGAKPSA